MIQKIDHQTLQTLVHGNFHKSVISAYLTPQQEKINTGKITFSVKIRKRRILISGSVQSVAYESSQTSAGYHLLQFFPNNPTKLQRILTDTH